MSDKNLIPLFDVRLRDEDLAAVEDTLRSGWLTMGPRTKKFEKIREVLGFEPLHRVPDGIDEIVKVLEAERFGDPFNGRFSNI